MQTDVIICPMLYAIAMGQIIILYDETNVTVRVNVLHVLLM